MLRSRRLHPERQASSLSFDLPAGYKYNAGAPFYVAYESSDEKALRISGTEKARNFTEPKFPLEIPVEAIAGQSTATIDSVIYFCNDADEKVCLVDSVRIRVPLEVTSGAPSRAEVKVTEKQKACSTALKAELLATRDSPKGRTTCGIYGDQTSRSRY